MLRTKSEPARDSVSRATQSAEHTKQTQYSSSGSNPVAPLHRTIGNQAIQRRAAAGTDANLRLGASDTGFEREAERVADRVMRMPESALGRPAVRSRSSKDDVHRMCTRCERRYRQGKPLNCPECEGELQRSVAEGEDQAMDVSLERAVNTARSGGKPLPEAARAFFEPRFGHDFGAVRVHTGTDADVAARSLNAHAFTVGHDIVFRSGEYDPESREGQRLLAHELVHVLQQDRGGTSGGPSPLRRSVSSDSSNGASSASSGSDGSAAPFTSPSAGYRVCARPLQSVLGTVANHAYIEADPYRYAIITRCTPVSGWDNVVTGTAATKTDRSPDPCGKSPTCVDCVPKPGVTNLDACFRAAYRSYNDPSLYKGLGPNSNTFAGTLARACCENMSPKPNALGRVPGWGDPPAPHRRATCPPGPPTC